MAKRFGESLPDGENQQGRSNDTGLSIIHHADIQPPLTEETQDGNVHTVHPAQDKELVGVAVQHQDGCHSPDQWNHSPERLHQGEEDLRTSREQTQLESLYGLCLEELKTHSLDPFLVEKQTNYHQAQNLGGTQSALRERFGQHQGQDRHEVLFKDEDLSEVTGGDLGHRVPQVYQHASLQSHSSDHSLLNPEESQQGIARQPEDREDKLDRGLSGDQHQPGADRDPQVLQANSDCLVPVAFGSLNSQSPAPALCRPYCESTGKLDAGLCLDPPPPWDPTQARPRGENHWPLLAQVTRWKHTRRSDPGGASEDEAGGPGGSPPALVITQAEESWRAVPPNPSPSVGDPWGPSRPMDLPLPAAADVPGEPSPGSSDGGDMVCSDLLSSRSDSISLASDATTSWRSEEGPDEDNRSMATSSVMSLYHRVHLDPLEKDWLRSSALGNISAQRLLLTQDPTLAHKKTALHWAAKQGRLDTVDLMFLSGVDVNVRSGYTALHLASIHSHQHMVLALINTYNAKTDIRDYHGKMADHYWIGHTDVFNKPGSQSGGKLSYGRHSQRYTLPKRLLSRSRSQGQLSLDFITVPQSPRLHVLDHPMGFRKVPISISLHFELFNV